MKSKKNKNSREQYNIGVWYVKEEKSKWFKFFSPLQYFFVKNYHSFLQFLSKIIIKPIISFVKPKNNFKKVIKLNSNDSDIEAYNALGILYAGQGRERKAEKQFIKAANTKSKQDEFEKTINLNLIEAYKNLGILYRNQWINENEKSLKKRTKFEEVEELFEKAEEKFKVALNLYKKNINNFQSLDSSKENNEVIKQTKNSSKEKMNTIIFEDSYIEICFNLGALYAKKGKENKEYYLKAEEQFNKTIALQPNLLESYFNLGVLYANQGKVKVEEAKIMFEKVLKLDNNFAKVYYNQGILFMKDEKLLYKVRHIFKKAIAFDDNYIEAYWGLWVLNIKQGNDLAAENILEKIITIDKNWKKKYYEWKTSKNNYGIIERNKIFDNFIEKDLHFLKIDYNLNYLYKDNKEKQNNLPPIIEIKKKKHKKWKSSMPTWLEWLLVIFFLIGIILIPLSGIIAFLWAKDFPDNSTLFATLLTPGLVLVGATTSFRINYWHKEKQQQKDNNLEFLKTAKEDINNYLAFLENKKNEDDEEEWIKLPINYLYKIKSKITTKISMILSNEENTISEEEKLLFRTNTPENFKWIIKNIKEKKLFSWERTKDIIGKNFYLKKANLQEAYFMGVNLKEAHLEETNLEKANLKSAHLEEAHLEGVNLRSSHLEGADLKWTYLKGANLWSAHLEEADLKWTHLEGANLQNTYFSYSFFQNKDYLRTESFLKAKNWETLNWTKRNHEYTAISKKEILIIKHESLLYNFDLLEIIEFLKKKQ